ncbi:hypothetical protein M1590_01205 [Candidatus Marsarchaeota archaeon]|nr:hypothetical protein [Candidatus Marsarchaeota archaeon]
MGFIPAAPDNEAIRQTRDHSKRQVELVEDLSKSSKNLEKLTKVLIVFTAALIVFGSLGAMTELSQYPAFISWFLLIIIIVAVVVVYAVFPGSIWRLITAGYLLLRYRKVRAMHATNTTTGEVSISVTATVAAHNLNPFTAEDYKAAISLFIISITFLWLSYQLQTIFPSTAGNVIGDLVISMWILLGGSIIILIVMVYRTLRG